MLYEYMDLRVSFCAYHCTPEQVPACTCPSQCRPGQANANMGMFAEFWAARKLSFEHGRVPSPTTFKVTCQTTMHYTF